MLMDSDILFGSLGFRVWNLMLVIWDFSGLQQNYLLKI
ncbi:hypothetical protein D1BOALGB6SA_1443 [Olavius sp. associated proteobacterium Delta 1]|nr:hypothetical protein D1BOALGB6SA_1443 [Olavius sp. associated proteobacterium Delta 1]